MKKINIFIFVMFGVMLFANVQTIKLNPDRTQAVLSGNNDYGFTANFQIAEIKSFDVNTEKGVFTQINIEDHSFTNKIGSPKLPVLRKIISVPLDAEVRIDISGYEIEEYSFEDFGITFPIFPAQESVSKSADPEDIKFVYNSDAYRVNGFDENPIVHIEESGILRSMRLFTLTIEPVKYNPSENTIRVFNDIEISVDFTGSDFSATNKLRERTFSPYFESLYSKFVFNYSNYSSRDDLTNYPITYVIVSDRMFEAQLEPFIDWKIEKGFNVIVGYTDQIGTSANAIKSYIQTIYNSEDPAPSFVLFVGDVAQVPAWNGNTGSHVTDLDYCEMTGDYMPEIYYGRFSARNTAELQPQIDKTLEYEKYEMPDPSFLGDVVMIAGMDSSHGSTWGNGQINYGTNYYFNAEHGIFSNTYLYPESGSNSQNIINDVSAGVGYVNYTAHGWDQGWADPEFTMNDLSGLQNDGKYPLAVGNCCLTNKFEVGECFGEAWLRAENKGGIGYIGGTNSTYWDEDYWWGVGAGAVTSNPTYAGTGPGAYDGLFHDHEEAFPQWYTTSYGIIMAGNLAVVQGGGSVNYYWEIYSIMGDPSLATYFGVPAENTTTYPATIFLGLTEVQITAEPYSYVGLSMNGESYGRGLIDESGGITLEIEPFIEPGMAKLVITRQNHQPVIADIEVIPNAGPFVIIDNYTIESGNDEIIEYGEYVSLSVDLENVGVEDALGLTMTIDCDDEYITISDNIQNIGDLPAGSTMSFENSFSFSVANNIPDNHSFILNANISEGDRDIWESTINLTAYAPVVLCSDVLVNDGINGQLDPGETTDIMVTLENFGGAAAANLESILSSSDAYITINNNIDTITELEAYSSGSVTYNITVDSACPIGHLADFNVGISANFEYSNTDEFDLTVGLIIEDFETGDFSAFPWEMSGMGNWFISSNAYEESYAAQSGNISDDQFTTLALTVNVLAESNISFWKKVSSEDTYDFLRFTIDNNLQGEWSGTVNWSEESYPVSAGEHTFAWTFDKDGSVSNGDDCGWIDYIILPPIQLSNPILNISIDSFNIEMEQGETLDETFEITNVGGGEINYEIDVDMHNSWFTLNDLEGYLPAGETDEISVTFDTSNLNGGDYSCNMMITDDIRNETVIPVNLTVLATSAEDALIPEKTALAGNFPNPFNPMTKISYGLRTKSDVKLDIYNSKGQKVRTLINENKNAGYHFTNWDGTDDDQQTVSSGVYFYKLKAGRYTSTKKMILMK